MMLLAVGLLVACREEAAAIRREELPVACAGVAAEASDLPETIAREACSTRVVDSARVVRKPEYPG